MERIAYVGTDRRIYLLDAPDAAPRPLAADRPGASAWPTWAPDGRRLALIHHQREAAGERARVEVWALDAVPRVVWASGVGEPICLGWAPDGRRLAMLVQWRDALVLQVGAPDVGGPLTMVADGAPLYWDWGPDGAALAVHVGGHYQWGDGARLLLARLEVPPADWPVLSERTLGFRVPAWEPGGQRLAYAAADAVGAPRLYLHDVATGEVDAVGATDDAPAMVWAPEGRWLAVGTARQRDGQYRALAVLDTHDGRWTSLPAPVMAFLWTPDSTALLCAVAEPDGSALAWQRMAPDGAAEPPGTRFVPTDPLALLLGHFDQYARSHALLSAEEPALLVADAGADTRHNGHRAAHAALYLASGPSLTPPRLLASGDFACFAPAARPS